MSCPAVSRRSVFHGYPLIWGLMLAGLCSPLAGGCAGLAARGLNAEGVRLLDQSRYQEAIQQFQQAIYTDPRNADGYYNLAAAYHRLGKVNSSKSDFDQAESYYNQCLDHDEDHPECYRGLAVLLLDQKRDKEAFSLIERWGDRSPSMAAPKIELARLFEESGDREAAKEHLIKALEVDPSSPRALAALGRLRDQLGEHAQALDNYRRSLVHDRFQPEVAARVAALQTALSPSPAVAAPLAEGTRTVTTGPATLR